MARQEVTERRASARVPVAGSAAIKVLETEILGPSRNVSREGIYFIAAAEIAVDVRLPDRDETLRGKIVRVGAVRDGELGIAIRFDQPLSADRLPVPEA